MLTITDKTKFVGPHQTEKLITGGADPKNAKAAMVMIHGRGATAESILSLANDIEHRNMITFYAPQAADNTWYPHPFLQPSVMNQPGLDSGLQRIFDVISEIEAKGIKKEDIFLLGFSQGACLASEFLARHPEKYAGLIVLSGGVIGDEVIMDNYEGDLEETPVFIGCSTADPHIPKDRLEDTEKLFKKLNADVTLTRYSGLGHTINEDEINEINKILHTKV
jgi:predicted esterase